MQTYITRQIIINDYNKLKFCQENNNSEEEQKKALKCCNDCRYTFYEYKKCLQQCLNKIKKNKCLKKCLKKKKIKKKVN